MKIMKAAIDAIKKASATISSIALWPLAIVSAKINKAIRPHVRQAFRESDFRKFIGLTMWPSVIFVVLGICIAIYVPIKPTLPEGVQYLKRFVIMFTALSEAFFRYSQVSKVWRRSKLIEAARKK